MIFRTSGSRFSATTRSSSSVTVTTQLFECRAIPLYFIVASCWLKLVRKLTLIPPPTSAAGGRLDDFQYRFTRWQDKSVLSEGSAFVPARSALVSG